MPKSPPGSSSQTEPKPLETLRPLPSADSAAPVPDTGSVPVIGDGSATSAGRAAGEGLRAELLHRLASLRGVVILLGLVGAGSVIAGFGLASIAPRLALWAGGFATLLILLALGAILADRHLRQAIGRHRAALASLHAADLDRIFLTDAKARALALDGQPGPGNDAVLDELADWCADPQEMVTAILDEVRRNRAARREFARPEAGLLVSAHRVTPIDDGGGPADDPSTVMWRFTRLERSKHRDIAMLGLPLLTLGPAGQQPLANPALMQLLAPPGSAPAQGNPQDLAIELLRPLIEREVTEAEITLPDGEPASAVMLPARDGLQDVLVLPRGMFAAKPAVAVQDFNELPVGVLRLDGQGRIAAANVAARQLMSLSSEDDRFLWEVVEGLGRPVSDWLQDARAGRALNRPEVVRVIRQGAEVFVQITLRRYNALSEPDTLLALVSDATELKNLEARFVQSQKMQAIGQLAGGVAHDFNNLLTAISGHCELILMRHDSSDVDYPDLMQIQQNSNRAAALVRQLLAFSRKQTLQFETLDLQGALAELVHLLNRLVGAKITLSLRFADQVINIRSDRRQFEQILVNLVVNARDAMPLGGEVVIETAIHKLPQGLMREQVTLPPGDYAVIEVRDKGQGIPKANLSKLFEPFFTTKRQGEGTGLGLSTVYGLVKQMGGFIFIDSEEGAGTTVSLYFKSQAASAPAQKSNMAKAATPALSMRPRSLVLLVEDEAPVRSFAARALQLQGHRVLEAESGEAALNILADTCIRPDLFVTDVIMPGIDGPGWINKIRDQYPDTPVVFMSGYAEDSRSAAQARIGNSVFLAKPFSLGDFTSTVNAQLLQHAPRDTETAT